MQQLNLPEYNYKLRQKKDYTEIFDLSRRKFVKLTPEEWVRQHFINYLTSVLNFPLSLIIVEKALNYNKLSIKADIIVCDNTGKPKIIVECKASDITLNQEVFDQVARYNFEAKVDYLIVTNGMEHYCCKMDYTNNSYEFIESIPDYSKLKVKS